MMNELCVECGHPIHAPCAACSAGTNVIGEIAAERQRQISGEGWTPEHDDQHSNGEMAKAAACYAEGGAGIFDLHWPWDRSWWKPTDRRRDLVKAGALIVAEIERLDRQANDH